MKIIFDFSSLNKKLDDVSLDKKVILDTHNDLYLYLKNNINNIKIICTHISTMDFDGRNPKTFQQIIKDNNEIKCFINENRLLERNRKEIIDGIMCLRKRDQFGFSFYYHFIDENNVRNLSGSSSIYMPEIISQLINDLHDYNNLYNQWRQNHSVIYGYYYKIPLSIIIPDDPNSDIILDIIDLLSDDNKVFNRFGSVSSQNISKIEFICKKEIYTIV